MAFTESDATKESEITLSQMLEARERRVLRQQELLAAYHKPLISFTMNIAGPVKTTALIHRAFLYGESAIRKILAGQKIKLIHYENNRLQQDASSQTYPIPPTGEEAFFVVDAPPVKIKELTVFLEDDTGIGRLFDMDVIRESGEKVDRAETGAPPRPCLICNAPAKGCARNRTHSVEELQEKTHRLLSSFFIKQDADYISRNACKALLYEAATTPKPGLVDRVNNGSHKDMDFFSFIDSAAVLKNYFFECAKSGILASDASRTFPKTETHDQTFNPLHTLLDELRLPGLLAEGEMLMATGGVNTHKGAIFSMGLLCAAYGRVDVSKWNNPEAVLTECSQMAKRITDSDFQNLTKDNAVTTGQKLYLEYAIRGARGQAEDGYPAVLHHGLPVLERELAAGRTKDMAGAICMLYLICAETDTNLIARSDKKTQEEVTQQIRALLQETPSPQEEIIKDLDREFTAKNLSPGGSADLLALCWMLHFMRKENVFACNNRSDVAPQIKPKEV